MNATAMNGKEIHFIQYEEETSEFTPEQEKIAEKAMKEAFERKTREAQGG